MLHLINNWTELDRSRQTMWAAILTKQHGFRLLPELAIVPIWQREGANARISRGIYGFIPAFNCQIKYSYSFTVHTMGSS